MISTRVGSQLFLTNALVLNATRSPCSRYLSVEKGQSVIEWTQAFRKKVVAMDESEKTKMFIDCFDVPNPKKPKFDEEKAKRYQEIGREYNRQTTIRHNNMMKALHKKIVLREEAIMAMPEKYRAAALELETSPVPEKRVVPTWTPPIPDFDPKELAKKIEFTPGF
uniref:Uncharacterized protein n=1 Tax=Fibrocapsa japonica TaxID=94617 RepID=A0A7S2UVP4_9STRA